MKILILAGGFPPLNLGGAVFSVFDLACGLQKAGNRVFVITTCQDKSLEGDADLQGLKVFRIFANRHERWRAYWSLYNPGTVGKVRRLLKEINPDIVHAHNIEWHLSYHCLKIAKESGKPLFWTARDVMPFSYEKLATRKYLERFDCRLTWLDCLKQAKKRYNPLRNILIKKYLRYVDQKFAVSLALKEALKQNGIQNVEVSYTSIDPADWQVDPELVEAFRKKNNLFGKKIIFFGGRISSPKGSEQINRAIAKVKKEIPEAHLLEVGREDGTGWLAGDELKAAYGTADIVVVPSVCFDSFPRTNLEAMACKKPVIATHYGGSPEIVQDGITGFIVNPFDTELMADKIIDLLKNPGKARQFGEVGFKRVKEKFSLESQIVQTLSYYQKYVG